MTTKRTFTILAATSAAAVLSLTACGDDGPTDSPESAAAAFATAWNQSDEAKDCVTMMTGSESDQHTASDMTTCLDKLGDFTPDESLEVFETEDIGDGKGVVIGHAGTEAFAVYVIEADDGWTPREYVMLTDGERAAGEGIPRLEGEVQSS